ncbi:MAG: Asp-tRNA(Asn)/Glu-tRNA(Gln) amidotransferase subunit GatA [Candidatus Falkowbacteria bacterium]
MELNRLNIQEARAKLDSGEISARELTEACLEQIAATSERLNAVLTLCTETARQEADEADKRLKNGERQPLLGIPYLCKDNIMTKGIRTTAASKILENYIAPYDATVIRKLKAAGAILLGKTNLDEFAHGASTENSAYGPTKNPWDLSRVPGGSSGGSAAGVAADLCIFAIGSDTGGSIRYPAAFCGVVGYKSAYGAVSRSGLLSMTSSTDVIGPITKTVADAALVYNEISGLDELDATTYPGPRLVEFKSEIKGLKIGLPKEYFVDGLDPEIKASIERVKDELTAAGATFGEVSLPYTEYGIPVYYIITPSEVSSNLARFDGVAWGFKAEEAGGLQEFYKKSRGQGFGPEAKRRIMLGTFALSAGYFEAYYKKAQAVRTLICQDFSKAFSEFDLLLTPTSPHPAFKIGEISNDPLAMYLEDIYVTGASLAGLPAISIPSGLVNRDGKSLPIAGQLIAPRGFENKLFSAASVWENKIKIDKNNFI